jgi:cytochrome c-type biogenesis protein CcmH/NrfF
MLRDDDSRVPLREMTRWLVPLTLVVLGITLFFVLEQRTSAMAVPIHVEVGSP